MGSSEVHAAPSAAPPQPRPADCPAGQDPEASLSRSKSSQQCSDQARKPVNSEQDSCSWTAPGASTPAIWHFCFPRNRSGKTFYTKIGSARNVAKDGISITLDATPVDGRMVLFPVKERDD
jgi:hypothetical protein